MLLRGITGFSSSPDEQLPTLDKRSFSKTCYHFAQENRCKILSINISVLERNFYYAEFEKYHFRFYLLQNIYLPYAAFAEKLAFDCIIFIDRPIDLIFCQSDIHILSLSELSKDPNHICLDHQYCAGALPSNRLVPQLALTDKFKTNLSQLIIIIICEYFSILCLTKYIRQAYNISIS